MVANELRVLFGRARTRVLLVLLALVPVLVAVAIRVSHSGLSGSGQGPAFIDSVSRNGVFAALVGLTVASAFLFPLAVSVVAGDTVAGEAGHGTLRYLLTAPVGRLRLLGVKYVAVVAFCLAGAGAIVAGGLIAGAVLFPVGPVETLSHTLLPLADGIGRIALAGLYLAVGLAALGAVGLFVSTLTDTPVAAMAATVVIAVVCEILDAVPQVAALHPYLLTHDWTAFADLLRSPVYYSAMAHGLLVALGWAAVAGTAAWARFSTRDVLC